MQGGTGLVLDVPVCDGVSNKHSSFWGLNRKMGPCVRARQGIRRRRNRARYRWEGEGFDGCSYLRTRRRKMGEERCRNNVCDGRDWKLERDVCSVSGWRPWRLATR